MSSDAGKSDDQVRKLVEIILRRWAEPDQRDQPLLGQYTEAIIDPHGALAEELLAKLATMPNGKVLFDDLNEARMLLGLNPFPKPPVEKPPTA